MKKFEKIVLVIISFACGVLVGSLFHFNIHLKLAGESLGSVADWLGAIGTLSAVIVSLYLANRGHKPRLYFYIEGQEKGGFFGVQNKSFNPVELEMKWGKQQFMLPLPPISNRINDLKSDNPFNGDYINLGIHQRWDKDKDRAVKLKAYDRVSGSKYKVYFYSKNGIWLAKQYKIIAIGALCI